MREKVTGTREAFERMLSERGIYKELGVSRSVVSNWKRALAGNDLRNRPSIEKMEEMLLLHGATIAQEKVWRLP